MEADKIESEGNYAVSLFFHTVHFTLTVHTLSVHCALQYTL